MTTDKRGYVRYASTVVRTGNGGAVAQRIPIADVMSASPNWVARLSSHPCLPPTDGSEQPTKLHCDAPEVIPPPSGALASLPVSAPADYEQMRTHPTWPLVMVHGQDYETLRRFFGFEDRRRTKR